MKMDTTGRRESDRKRTDALQAILQTALAGPLDVLWSGTVVSTNDQVKDVLRSGRPSSDVVRVADRQSRGRGTRGRTWDGVDDALLVSVGTKAPRSSAGLPLALGVALRDVLTAAGATVWVKWPNDLWNDRGKLGGILCETIRSGGEDWLVVGVGLNLRSRCPGHGDLGLLRFPKEGLCARIVRTIHEEVSGFSRARMRDVVDRWPEVDGVRNRKVVFVTPDGTFHPGTFVGVDPSGSCLLRDAEGVHRFTDGSLRWVGYPDVDSFD